MISAWYDALQFAGKLSPRRVLNALLVLCSYYLTRFLGRPVQWGLPITLSFEPTTACNLRCPECPSGLRAFTRPTGNMKSDFFRRTIDDLYRDSAMILFYFQGEPFIHPEFLQMVRYAHDKGLYTATSTNGHFFDDAKARETVESGLDRLIVSIDGATQDSYQAYRVEGNLEQVLEGLRRVAYWKRRLRSRTPYIIMQTLVVRPNEAEIPALRKIARELGADAVHLKSAQLYDYREGHPLMPRNPRYNRYKQGPDGTWAPKHYLGTHCWKLWHACVITWDGIVAPCCFDKDASHRMGDLKMESFRSVWQGLPYRLFRAKLLSGRQNIDICTNCSEGCKVRL